MNAIEMKHISKSFHGAYANKDISFSVRQGEIHSLLGENGAGKTTLMKILFGLYRPDEGEIRINDKPAKIHSPHDAIACGLSMVHQHFVQVENLTVTENIIVGHEPKKGLFLDRKGAEEKVKNLIDRYHFQLDPKETIENLSVGERQRVEILKALYNDASILLLDEPTAVLTPPEVAELFEMLRNLKKENKTIVIITHKLKETLEIADRVTILRKGETICTREVSDTDENQLAELMVGRPVSFEVERTPWKEDASVRLEVSHISLSEHKRTILDDISLQVRSGEILGIAGVEGNGQTELIEVITGIRHQKSGSVSCEGEVVSDATPKKMLRYIGHIPEERGVRGFVKGFTNWENFILGYHDRPEYETHGFLHIKKIREKAEEAVKRYDVRTTGIDQMTQSLSGGNQQKLIIGRTLMHQNRIILAAQPTRGVDIGAIEYIHAELMKMRDQGSAILLFSADLDEVVKLSDRIAVIYEGKIQEERRTEDFSKKELGYYMLGGAKGHE